MSAIDLFAGAGGWDVTASGIDVTGFEIDHAACRTRVAAGHKTVEGDVNWYDPNDYRGTDGLIASPPCTDFSAAGLRRGIDGPTGALVAVPMRWAEVIRPRWIAWEQVPPVLAIWEEYALALQGLGYKTWTGLLHAEQYGVPQTRKRAFLMAHRDTQPAMPTPTHSRYYPRDPKKLDPDVLPWVSMAEALGWGVVGEVLSNYNKGGVLGQRGVREFSQPYSTITGKTDRDLVMPASGSGWQFAGAGRTARYTAGQVHVEPDQPSHTITGANTAVWTPKVMGDVRQSHGAMRSVGDGSPTLTASMDNGNYQWVSERPSTTDVGSFRPEVVAAPGWRTAGSGPRQNTPGSVRVTVQEAGVLQSFPADYPWRGTKSKQYQQVGNAVPPLLAGAVLRSLLGVSE